MQELIDATAAAANAETCTPPSDCFPEGVFLHLQEALPGFVTVIAAKRSPCLLPGLRAKNSVRQFLPGSHCLFATSLV